MPEEVSRKKLAEPCPTCNELLEEVVMSFDSQDVHNALIKSKSCPCGYNLVIHDDVNLNKRVPYVGLPFNSRKKAGCIAVLGEIRSASYA